MNIFVIKFLLGFILGTFISCSMLKNNSSSDEYMPLSVGNKWIYEVKNDPLNSVKVKEIVGIDTIREKVFCKFKTWDVIKDSIRFEYEYFMRISNDTLFRMDYNSQKKEYVERIEAIFSLALNKEIQIDFKKISLNKKGLEGEKDEIRKLPKNGKYYLEITNKTKNTIEVSVKYDIYQTTKVIYKKGVGFIQSESLILKKYEIN